jgi:RHS repeat-associated protein
MFMPHSILPATDETLRQTVGEVSGMRFRNYDQSIGRFTSFDVFEGDPADPLTLHKYAYAHADPVNGMDPTGLFFTAVSAGITHSVKATLGHPRVAAALTVLDRASTFADVVSFVSQLAAGVVNPGIAAGLLLSVIPFGSLFKRAKLVWSGSVAKGGKGVLNGAGDGLSEIYGAINKAGIGSTPATKVAGDLGAVATAKKLGFKPVDDFPAHYRGIDGMFLHGDDLVVVEAKGLLTSSGGMRLGPSRAGGEMSQEWMRAQVAKIRRRGSEKHAKLLEEKINSGKVKGLVVETRVDEATGKLADPVFELKNWADIGPTTW